MFILRGVHTTGDVQYYTGKAGDGWVNYSSFAAFTYNTRIVAHNKAISFNKMTSIHGFHFTVQEVGKGEGTNT